MGAAFTEVKDWLAAPFHAGMSAATLFFSVGLTIVIILFWVYILERLEEVG